MDDDKPCYSGTCAAGVVALALAVLLLAGACLVVGGSFVIGFFDVMLSQFSWWQWCLAVVLMVGGMCCVIGAIANEQRTVLVYQ
jgi:hypothetical protein